MPSQNSSRSTTPRPGTWDQTTRNGRDSLQRSQGEDHTISYNHYLSFHRYPPDCPPVKPRWFYAVDTPKYKVIYPEQKKGDGKPLQPPKKFVPFSLGDTQSIEAAFQRLVNSENPGDAIESRENARKERDSPIKVPVNEDYLFDVDVEQRELAPAYWLGPVYEVRRGTWFYQEGSALKPCDENLATQLEEGYLKVKPWQFQDFQSPKSRPPASSITSENRNALSPPGLIPETHDTETANRLQDFENICEGTSPPPPVNEFHTSHRLFGAYMNSTATYQDTSTAWLTNNDFVSRMSSTVYQRLGGVAGTKVVRGYSIPNQSKEIEAKSSEPQLLNRTKTQSGPPSKITGNDYHAELGKKLGQLSPSPSSSLAPGNQKPLIDGKTEEKQRPTLDQHMSSLMSAPQNISELQNEIRQQEEEEMLHSGEADSDERGREIDCLILVTHGIGQRLGIRLESINFVHDVNVLRKTMKSVYAVSPDLQALNSAHADAGKNCRVQVLPV
jgi:hypothetical protein